MSSDLPNPLPTIRQRKSVIGGGLQTGDGQPSLPRPPSDLSGLTVSPLFVRKSSTPETPLFRSEPLDGLAIHSPIPKRKIPPLKPSLPSTAVTPVSDAEAYTLPTQSPITKVSVQAVAKELNAKPQPQKPSTVPGLLEPIPAKVGKPRVPPFAHFHGTREQCVRHGRKPRVMRSSPGREDAMSPWDMLATPGPAAVNGQDACPDCVAELSIRKREFESGIDGSTSTFTRPPMSAGRRKRRGSSMVSATPSELADAKPPSPQLQSRVGSGTGKSVHFSGPSELNSSELEDVEDADYHGDLVIAADLGEGLDAVICERGGRLERVITNLRTGEPTLEMMAKLSRELVLVSNAIASARLDGDRADAQMEATNDRAMVIGRAQRHDRDASLPELMDMIDDAASHLDFSPASLSAGFVDDGPGSDQYVSSLPSGQLPPSSVPSSTPAKQFGGDSPADEHSSTNRSTSRDTTYYPPVNNLSQSSTANAADVDHQASAQLLPVITTLPETATIPARPPPYITITTPTAIASASSTPSQPFLAPGQHVKPPSENSLFTTSTCPSPSTPPDMVFTTAASTPVVDFPAAAAAAAASPNSPEPPVPRKLPLQPPSVQREEQQAIRHAMRMGRNDAVREAAMRERMARRERLEQEVAAGPGLVAATTAAVDGRKAGVA